MDEWKNEQVLCEYIQEVYGLPNVVVNSSHLVFGKGLSQELCPLLRIVSKELYGLEWILRKPSIIIDLFIQVMTHVRFHYDWEVTSEPSIILLL